MRLVTGLFCEEIVSVGTSATLSGPWNAFRPGQFQSPINFVRRDVIKSLPFPALGLPVLTGSLKEGQGSEHIGLGESERIKDGPVHMAFGREVDDSSYSIT